MRAGPILYLQEVHLPRGAAAGARQQPPRAPESTSARNPPTAADRWSAAWEGCLGHPLGSQAIQGGQVLESGSVHWFAPFLVPSSCAAR